MKRDYVSPTGPLRIRRHPLGIGIKIISYSEGKLLLGHHLPQSQQLHRNDFIITTC
jgi:hypothetical protein